jgi:hypothetical protein
MKRTSELYTPVQGKTYSLFAECNDSERYYVEIRFDDLIEAKIPADEATTLIDRELVCEGHA